MATAWLYQGDTQPKNKDDSSLYFTNCILSCDNKKSEVTNLPVLRSPYIARRQLDDVQEFNRAINIPIAFIKGIRALPVEIRREIYELCVWQWSPLEQSPQLKQYADWDGWAVSLARRNSKPALPPGYNPTAAELFSYKHGLLDFIKFSERAQLSRFVLFLERFEGRFWGTEIEDYEQELQGVGEREEERAVGLLKDFMRWFWDTVVVQMNVVRYKGNSQHHIIPPMMKPCPADHAQHHCMLSNLSLNLEIDTLDIIENYAGAPMIHEVRKFMNHCKHISKEFPRLKTLLLFLNITPAALNYTTLYPRSQPWVHRISKLLVSQRFDLRVTIAGYEGFLDMDRNWSIKSLEDMTMPMSLRIKELDEDMGLEKLFREQE